MIYLSWPHITHTMLSKMKTIYCGSNHIGCCTAVRTSTIDFSASKCDSAVRNETEHVGYVAPYIKSIQGGYVVAGISLFPMYAGSRVTQHRTCYSNGCTHDNLIVIYIACHCDYRQNYVFELKLYVVIIVLNRLTCNNNVVDL